MSFHVTYNVTRANVWGEKCVHEPLRLISHKLTTLFATILNILKDSGAYVIISVFDGNGCVLDTTQFWFDNFRSKFALVRYRQKQHYK